MNRKVDVGACRYNLDAEGLEMEATAGGILEALSANEGTIVTHTGNECTKDLVYISLEYCYFKYSPSGIPNI